MAELLILLSALAYSTSGVWSLLIKDQNCPAIMQVIIRMVVVSGISLIILLLKKENLKINKKQAKASLIFGSLGFTINLTFYSMSVAEMSVGPTALVHYSYPIIVAVISAILFKEKLGLNTLLASIFMVAGMYLSNSGGSMSARGIFYALITALSFGSYVIGQGRSAMREIEPFKLLFYNSFFSLLLAILIALVTNQFTLNLSSKTILCMSAGAICATLFGSIFLSLGVRKIGPVKAGYLSILEPVFSYVWDIILFHARPSLLSIIGIILILISFAFTLFKPKESKQNN